MADCMDVDNLFDIPGGEEFAEVTEYFTAAANDMDPETLLLTEGFTLLDAMSAFEIGEPRMDSGMIIEHQRRPPFNPAIPLLPQEVCWLLDKMISCEMGWHSGGNLSQTVYTLLYVHYLGDMDPDFMAQGRSPRSDHSRPFELVHLVLRAAVFGMLKCCDLTWRELSKGKVYELEDWMSEKCEVSLLEHITAEFVMQKLIEASGWLRHSDLDESDITRINDRLQLRKILLKLFQLNLPLNLNELHNLLVSARELIGQFRSETLSILPNSPVFNALDPYISRRLPNFMPLVASELMPQDKAWDNLEHLLNGWSEVGRLLDTSHLQEWEIAGSLRIWMPQKRLHLSYVRSLAQCLILDKNTVFGIHHSSWLIDRFYREALGISHKIVLDSLDPQGDMVGTSLLKAIDYSVSKAMVADLRSYWHNPPRRRRLLMKSVLQWHELYDQFIQLLSHCRTTQCDTSCLELLPHAATMRRLTATREIILSGFQVDLYALEEIPIAYWYLSRVLDAHLECIDEVLGHAPEDSMAREELTFQLSFLAALQIMSTAMCAVTYKQATLSYERMSLNFTRRYKWAFKPEYDSLAPAIPLPDLTCFRPQVEDLLLDAHYSPSLSFRQAGDILRELADNYEARSDISMWSTERVKFVRQLGEHCRFLEATPSTTSGIDSFDVRAFIWRDRTHPWYPDIVV